jgi:hypothetical protein
MERRATGGEKDMGGKRKRKENLTDIRNWTKILTPNVIVTHLKVILVYYHT